MRLLCDENIVGLDAVGALCELRTAAGRELHAGLLGDTDALWVRSVTRVDATLLEGTPVRLVATATAGTEHVDLDYLAARGIAFHAAPGANANSVVEYVLAALARLGDPWAALDAGGCLGIVGYGQVGRRLHEVARSLGWPVRVCDPWVEHHGAVAGVEFVALDDLLHCTVLSLHCALTDRDPWPSRHLLEARRLGELRAGQWLVNAARGEVVDGDALLRRLEAPGAPAVVLDVWEHEPVFDRRLLQAPALRLATAHIAGHSWDAKWAATRMLASATFGEETAALRLQPPAPVALRRPAEALHPLARQVYVDELLGQRYAIAADDRMLREVAAIAKGEERGRGFDRLRRGYAARRELRGSMLPVQQPPGGDEQRLLESLGVGVEVKAP